MVLPPPECRVYTPAPLAHAMVQAVDFTADGRWLDPCMGPGVFVACLRENGVQKKRIVGVDIDPQSGAEDRFATAIRGVDFFKWCAATAERFDRIVANPPYVAIRKLHPKLQESLAAFRVGGDGSFGLRSNYWCAFLSACLRVLADHGSLAFVLPAAWDYAQYASEVRRAVHEQFEMVEVHRSHEPLFSDVREGCVVLVAKGYRKNPSKAIRIAHDTGQALIAALTKKVDGAPAERIVAGSTGQHLTPFSDLYSVKIGCVTGNVNYFLLRESDRLRLKLPLEAVRPVVSKARHLTTAYLTSTEWNRLLKADERVWLFYPEPKVLQRKAVQTYLELGQEKCDLEGYKLRNREPWYRVSDVCGGASGFLSGMTKRGPWISFRSKRDLIATNTLYTVAAKAKMTSDERAAWALSLISTSSRQQFLNMARCYPDGLPKLEPHDLNSLLLQTPQRTKRAHENYGRAIGYLVAGRIAEAVAIADEFTEQR
jgi:adenine-specific DNA-methyltransferase